MPNVHFKAFTLSNLEGGLFNFMYLQKKPMRVKYEAGRVIFLRVHTSAEIPSAFEL